MTCLHFFSALPRLQNQTNLVFANSTIRQTLHISIGAEQIRVRLSNAFGTTDLPITAVTIALPFNGSAGASAIQPGTVKSLTFSGNASAVIPNGALIVSDPIDFAVKPQSVLAVTIYLATGQPSNYVTSHPGSRTTSWFTFGNYVNVANLTGASVQSAAHWYAQSLLMILLVAEHHSFRYFLSAVEGWVHKTASAFAIVGDSITDGRGSTTDQNNRFALFPQSPLA